MEHKIKGTSDILHKSKRKDTTVNQELEYWMTRLPEALKNIPIIHLAIPGKFRNIFLLHENLYLKLRQIDIYISDICKKLIELY